jgi:hypothetical protein
MEGMYFIFMVECFHVCKFVIAVAIGSDYAQKAYLLLQLILATIVRTSRPLLSVLPMMQVTLHTTVLCTVVAMMTSNTVMARRRFRGWVTKFTAIVETLVIGRVCGTPQ